MGEIGLNSENVTPSFAAANVANGRNVQVVLFSDGLTRCSSESLIADSHHLIDRQLMGVVSNPYRRALTRVTIMDVVCLRSQDQMARIDARRIVAGMTDEQPARDRSVGDFVGNSVRQQRFVKKAELAVTEEAVITTPEPTVRATINTSPKALFPVSRAGRVVARLRAELNVIIAGIEKRAATIASALGILPGHRRLAPSVSRSRTVARCGSISMDILP